MTEKKFKYRGINLQEAFSEDKDALKELLREVLQEVLEAEMSEALGAEKGERGPGRLGYRSGYYSRSLVTRVGKLELRVPQNLTCLQELCQVLSKDGIQVKPEIL